ncbi:MULTISPECIES: M48 family metalloprotease [Halorussus]|uniref:M48 family metalloprotease n=1 Tax=Halorussus TaxID=1070314 RepID=UPI00209F6217|nr:M48 family metalloprotease [Halorussus vallis]USZ74593.1 M48 family metalloprotease [Halorussus vallis]
MRHAGLKARMVLSGTIVFAFYAAMAWFLRGLFGLPVILALSVVFAAAQYKLGKWLALRGVGAEDLPEDEYPEVHRTVERLSDDMEIPKPRLMVGRMGVPNAFAVGRKGAGVVVVSETLLELLEDDELEGVLAHELAHVKNRDVVLMVLGQSVAQMLGMVVFWVVALADDGIAGTIVAWILSAIVQMVVTVFVLAISRHREYVADSDAAEYTGDPEAMASALAKIAQVGRHDDAPDVQDRVGALCIFGGKRGLLATLFATHPPMEKRIARLAPELLA